MITPEQLAKLPKWAQEHIEKLTRQRETAVRALDKWINDQHPSPFYIDELDCTGEQAEPTQRRRYIQGYRMTIEHCGVRLDIILREDGRDKCIDLQWDTPRQGTNMVAAVPWSFQQMRLVAKENMR